MMFTCHLEIYNHSVATLFVLLEQENGTILTKKTLLEQTYVFH